MYGAVLHALGTPPRYEQFADPVARDGEAIVEVRAASLKPVDKQMAAGSHFASPRELPVICGTDGVGYLSDGKRVFFGGARPPYGTMAERTVVKEAFCFPVPDELDDETAAALPNPGVSAWLSLVFRGELKAGDNVLVLGATGTTGKLAVKIAKLLGAGRVVAAGRNEQVLRMLPEHGADATIRLEASEDELRERFASTAGESGFQLVLDYVWGRPVEVLLSALARNEFSFAKAETRLVQVGESAGPTISLPAAVLRSTALTIMGTAGIPPMEVLANALQKVMAHGASGDLTVATESVALREIEESWVQEYPGRRVVVKP
jgi:NADPH:quinone reductase-like Zn-dependent oxidoreductase